ncbi:class I SAM-dependent methyltransferase [Ramlibacter rhizophilus]|uniref:Class I SAM-dependent methyltransferase n=1 Tax=Ramlibacter rhizophilus TaxID=1781167 RepID=A0A4Z0C1T4_9BURK|nr:class I SAM-dependent methyltransferase [Ramlibacter rhizophilus]TFZ04205.1 class I SAM-dependent methyltransferase [Ramlibacter rhizophilus]
MNSIDKLSHNWLMKRALNSAVARHLHLLQGRVYDFGCGTMPYEADILERAEEYVGVDWSNTLHGTRCELVADLNSPLPIPSESADAIVSFEVLEHLCEPLNMLREANRILRPGGVILITVPFQWWVHESPWDYFRYTRFGLDYLLRKAGFEDVCVEETTGFWEMWVLKLNYQSLRLIKGPRLLRKLIRAILVPLWWVSQTTAGIVSSRWASPNETAGYVVVGRKPGQAT